MPHKFAVYNFQYFFKKRKENEDVAWFSTSGILALGFAFNASTILFLVFGYYADLYVPENPGYIFFGIPWAIFFIAIFFNKRLKKTVVNNKINSIESTWKYAYWAYYILSGVIYAYSMSYYSF